MVFEHIDKLKREYTDKYVVVDASRPDLRRFEGITGTVKTVNMSGRALVQFDAYDNIGWYDIDVDYLKIIDKPLPKPESKAKAEPEPKAGAAKTKTAPPTGAKPSVADMLAAARGQKSGTRPTTAAKPAPEKPKAPAKPDADKAAAGKPAGGMSVADILSAARGGKPAAETVTAPAAPQPDAPTAEESATSTDGQANEVAETVPAAEATAKAVTPRSNLPTSVADIVAFCKKTDAK